MTIAANIRELRMKKFPGRGGAKKCALAYGVSPQQWSPWERGTRTPGEMHLNQLAAFFEVDVAAFLEPRDDVSTEEVVPLFTPIDAEPEQRPPLESFPPITGPDELLTLLLNRRVKAIYRVELSVTELKYESS